MFKNYQALPKWAQWMPIIVILLLAFLIGAIIDLNGAKAELAQLKQEQTKINNPSDVTNSENTAAQSTSKIASKISYKDAKDLYRQLEKPILDTGMFYKKTAEQRIEYVKDSIQLESKFAVFGDLSQCKMAAASRTQYIQDLNTFARVYEGHSSISSWQALTNPMNASYYFADHVSGCYDEVEALDISNN